MFSKSFFRFPLNWFYDLELMMHIICIFAEYQTGVIADHCFEAVT